MFVTVDQPGRDFSPFFMLLQAGDFHRAQKEIKQCPSLSMQSVKIQGFYDKKISSTVNGLQLACAQRAPPVEFIKKLQEANPKALKEVDSTYQRNALHIAVMNNASYKVIQVLVKANQKCATVQDVHGRLPIHYACKDAESGEQTIRCLLRAHPESANVADDAGFLPLHVACRMGLSMSIIRLLLRTAPETILAKTNKGSTPVHCAKQYKGRDPKAQEQVVETLNEVANETKKMVRLHDQSSHSVSSSKSGNNSTMSSYYSRYTIRDTWNTNTIPDQISLSERSMAISESSIVEDPTEIDDESLFGSYRT